MEKEYNDNIDYGAIEGDFMGFLEEKDWEGADAVITNLADLKEFPKALELCMKRCAAIPADYGEEKKDWRGKPVKTYGHAEFEADNGFDVW